MTSDANSSGANAKAYIIDSDYLRYRLELVRDAMTDPIIKKRLESAQSMEAYNDILKAEIQDKLRIYRDDNNLDENGASRE